MAKDTLDGKYIYYAKNIGSVGLWRVVVEGGDEIQVLDRAVAGWWAVAGGGIYFLDPQARPHPAINLYNSATGQTMQVATVTANFPLGVGGPSFAASPDGRWILYTQVDQVNADIMLVEHFR